MKLIPVVPSNERRVVEDVRRLARQAWGVYRDARGKDGHGRDLRRSYEMLLRAKAQLEMLRGTDEVEELRVKVTQMIVDVFKSLPIGS